MVQPCVIKRLPLNIVPRQGLLYEGNNDIVCNHGGVVALLENMFVWDGKDEYYGAKNEVGRHKVGPLERNCTVIPIVISAPHEWWKTCRLYEVGEEAKARHVERRWPRSSTQSTRGCLRHVQKIPRRKCTSGDTLNLMKMLHENDTGINF